MHEVTTFHMVISFVLLLILGAMTAVFAERRGRDPWIWFFVGMLLGLLGLLLLFILPPAVKTKDEKPPTTQPEPQQTLPEKLWYYLDQQHAQHGPVPLSQLKDLMAKNELSAASYVWSEGMETWKKIGELKTELNDKS